MNTSKRHSADGLDNGDSSKRQRVVVESSPSATPIDPHFTDAAPREEEERESESEKDADYLDVNLPNLNQITRAFKQRNFVDLVKYLKTVDLQIPKATLNEQVASNKRLSKAEQTIQALRSENLALRNRLQSCKVEMDNVNKSRKTLEKDHQTELDRLQSIISDARANEIELASSIEDIKKFSTQNNFNAKEANLDLKLNFINALTGINCYQVSLSETHMVFSVKHSSFQIEFYYNLYIPKVLTNDEDIKFEPIWNFEDIKGYPGNSDEWEENVSVLKDILPQTFYEKFDFNSSNIYGLFSKLTKCLRKAHDDDD